MTKPFISKKHWLSGLWLLPLISALVGSWVIYKSMQEEGTEISIIFQDANGIRAGKTAIMYKGVRVGLVKKVYMSEDFKQVEVIAEIEASSHGGLKDTTGFWLVKPRVSITEITGLETIVSGNYIRIKPGKGDFKSHFIALLEPPILEDDAQGLFIDILSDHLGSVSRGAKIYFREIPVGEVLDYDLAPNQKGVIIKGRIEHRYANLVKKSSRFWNASGLSVKASLAGLSVHMESLAALMAGGIAFYTPDTESKDNALKGEKFKLYGDFDSAKVGISVQISFESALGLEEGVTEVKYDAFKIGIVKKISYKKTGKSVIAEVVFDPRAEELLKAGTKFWLDKPKFSLADFSGLSSLLQGRHIKMQIGDGVDSRHFKALNKPPLILSGDKGIHIVLTADALDSIEYASPVLYKKIQVGQVHDFKLNKKGDKVLIDIYITERYAHLVNKDSRFWNTSGINVKVSPQGLAVQTGTFSSMLSGGVEFITPVLGGKKVKNGTVYPLFTNHDNAVKSGIVMYQQENDSAVIYVKLKELGSLNVGSKLYFKKIPVGEVVYYTLSEPDDSILMQLSIDKKFKHLVTEKSCFWRNSGLQIKAGLSGVDVKFASVHSLLNGGISFENNVLRAHCKPQHYVLFDNKEQALERAVFIEIQFSLATGISEGTVIKYLGLPVGKITKVVLTNDNKAIIAYAKLTGSAMDFARSGTKFWLVSAELGLFKNKHLDTLIKGSYLAIEPGKGEKQKEFKGYLNLPDVEKGLHIVLKTKQLGSISRGDGLYYRQVKVGEVQAVHLSKFATEVLIDVYIAPKYTLLIRENSRFWNVSGVKVDVGLFTGTKIRAESMETIIAGGIAFATPNSITSTVHSGHVFNLSNDNEERWLKWSPKINLSEVNE